MLTPRKSASRQRTLRKFWLRQVQMLHVSALKLMKPLDLRLKQLQILSVKDSRPRMLRD